MSPVSHGTQHESGRHYQARRPQLHLCVAKRTVPKIHVITRKAYAARTCHGEQAHPHRRQVRWAHRGNAVDGPEGARGTLLTNAELAKCRLRAAKLARKKFAEFRDRSPIPRSPPSAATRRRHRDAATLAPASSPPSAPRKQAADATPHFLL